ncbi:hypothetical protein NQ420_27025, partial [Escherichia coli]|uniref:hypothetical protein n=3 Tax=Escherichia coli TaxID=562 RepID=UPI001B3BD196
PYIMHFMLRLCVLLLFVAESETPETYWWIEMFCVAAYEYVVVGWIKNARDDPGNIAVCIFLL